METATAAQPNKRKINLHGMSVKKEAVEAVQNYFSKHPGPFVNYILIITGQGKHNQGGPAIKPRVKRWLREKGIQFYEQNPGALKAKIPARAIQ